jgi:predicted Zn-dependent protease
VKETGAILMNHRIFYLKGVCLSLLFASFLFQTGCSGSSDDNTVSGEGSFALDIAQLYSSAETIVVNVAYEQDAEPCTGATLSEIPCWDVIEVNIQALFEGRIIEPDIVVPKELSEMEQIPAQDELTWTAAEIIDLARSIWDPLPSLFIKEFFVLFINGYLDNDGTANTQVLGVSVVGTPVIAVFKDVVLASSSSSAVLMFVEQATLVHEFGHVMGLVNNGVEMVTDHLDTEHPRHCTNEDCVMYWQNEGVADLRSFVQQMLLTSSPVMYGQECLDDTRGYTPEE